MVDNHAMADRISRSTSELFNDIRDVVLVTNRGSVTEVYGPFEALFGYAREASLKSPVSEVLTIIEGDYERLLAEATKRRGEAVRSSVRLLAGRDKTHWVEVAIREITQGRNLMFQLRRAHVVAIRDCTAETELRLQISRLSAADPVTELANSTRFRELLNVAMHRTQRTGQHLAVLSITIDSMEMIRAVYDPSDVARIQVDLAKRIANALRTEDIVGHLDSDEFGVVLSGMEPKIGRAYAVDVADRIATALAEPIAVGGSTTTITANIGIAHGTAGPIERKAVDLINDARVARSEVEANADRWKNLRNPT